MCQVSISDYYQISQIDVPGEFLTAIPEFITKTLPDKPKAYQVLFKHKNSDNYLSIDEESLGTQMIFAFIPFLADSLKNKKVLIIDELDKSLHPFLVQYIVEIFNDAEINKNGSQLIFNTHDTNLLDLNNVNFYSIDNNNNLVPFNESNYSFLIFRLQF